MAQGSRAAKNLIYKKLKRGARGAKKVADVVGKAVVQMVGVNQDWSKERAYVKSKLKRKRR